MTRFAPFVVLALLAGGCSKPDEASCRKALVNMRVLMGTDNLADNNKTEGEVRRCKGGSSKKAVQCAINAKTYDELRNCGFSKLPATLPVLPDTVRPSGAATGSAAAGSAMGSAAGSAMGSAAGSAMGSAAGSAATGSAN